MATKNYQSDFNFILKLYTVLKDKDGKEVSRTELSWPDYDWTAKFWTSSKPNAYTASCIGGVCTNCRNSDGKVLIVVNDHHMGLGTLKVDFKAELPRELYPDGSERNVVPGDLDIELVRGAGDFPSDFEAELLLPYIKGDAFTYDDFTPEQLADLRRPATEAASDLSDIKKALAADEQARTKAETERQAAEHTRGDNEGKRIADETARQTAEEQRSGNETARTAAEKIRADAEALRVKAEELRAEAEKLRDEAEKLRVSAEEARKAAEAQRVTDEKKRKSAEDTRVTNETARKSAEDTRSANETTRQANETTRQNNETTRTANENARVSAEQSRVAAEEARVKAFQAFESRIKALENKRVILLED